MKGWELSVVLNNNKGDNINPRLNFGTDVQIFIVILPYVGIL